MARVLVTGAAGFIGSHLVERLLGDGHDVTGLDARRGGDGRARAEGNLGALLHHPRFRLSVADLLDADLRRRLEGVETVFHLAGRPGVRESWGSEFPAYVQDNLLATQRLAVAAVAAGGPRLVFASTSSVYGSVPAPFRPDGPTCPVSPYGVTKLAAEALLRAYGDSYGLPVTVLRYFTVYGPRQRRDMAFARWLQAVHRGEAVTVYGEGARRDFTYVADVVEATVRAAAAPPWRTYNVAAGTAVEVEEALRVIGEICGRAPEIRREPRPAGDPSATWADISATAADLGYRPAVGLEEGLRRQWQAVQGEADED